MRIAVFTLAVGELAWGLPRCILEHAGEVLGVFEAQLARHLVDGPAAEDEVLGTPDDELAYVVLRALAKGIADDVAKIARRQAQFAGAMLHAGQSVLLLHAVRIVVGQHLLESAEDVAALSRHLLILATVESVAVVEYEQDVVADDVVVPECLRLRCQLPAQVCHELAQGVLFLGGQEERLVGVVGKELVAVELLLDGRPVDELAVEQQHPSVILPLGAVVPFAAYLAWREGYQRAVAVMVGADAVGQPLGELLLHEDAIAAGAVQRVAYLAHLVVVYHGDVGMQHGRTDVPCVVVCFVDIQVYRHNRRKRNIAVSRLFMKHPKSATKLVQTERNTKFLRLIRNLFCTFAPEISS